MTKRTYQPLPRATAWHNMGEVEVEVESELWAAEVAAAQEYAERVKPHDPYDDRFNPSY